MNLIDKLNKNILTTPVREKGNNLIDFQNEYVVIDIETTGFDPQYDEIIEVSALRICDNEVIDIFTSFVKPKNPINTFITELIGITNEMVEDAPLIEEVIEDYYNFFSNLVLVGHNVNFDINFLYDKLLMFTGKTLSNDFVDTMRIGRRLLKELKKHRLIDLAENYNISTDGNHRSQKDCEITNEVYKNLKIDAIEKHGSIEEFQNSCIYRRKNIDIKSITPTVYEIDENSILFGKEFVFTGTLERMKRNDVFQIVINLGGICADNITKKSSYLVLGNNDYLTSLKNNKSRKHIKAENLKLSGLDIEIISESVFYDMLESYSIENR